MFERYSEKLLNTHPTLAMPIAIISGYAIGFGITASILLTALFIFMFFGFGWAMLAVAIAGYMQNVMQDPEQYDGSEDESFEEWEVRNLIIAWKVWMFYTWIIIGLCYGYSKYFS